MLGGTCLNWGCIPTKALLEHAHALKVTQEAAQWGISFGKADVKPVIDMARVNERKTKIVTLLTKGVEFLFKKNAIEWVKGTGRLAGKGKVEVTGGAGARTLTAREIIVATGSSARSVPGIEIDRKTIITSDQAINLTEVPKSIAIMGSGAVGVEFASIFRRFGSEVTLIELLPRIVPNEDEAVSAELSKAFRKRGIAVKTSTKVTSAKVKGGSVTIEMQDSAGKSESLTIEKLLVATGRGPVTDGLGAVEAGLKLDRGYVLVDDLFRTNVAGISAIGDVITMGTRVHQQLAHLSSAEGIVLAERLAGRDVQPINYDHVPACTYCEPEIGSIGLTEQQAKDRGYDVRVGHVPVWRARPREDGRRDRRVREDRRREEARRTAGRPHDRPARDRTGRRGGRGAAARMHGRGTDSHDSRASDDGGGRGRSGARRARRGDTRRTFGEALFWPLTS